MRDMSGGRMHRMGQNEMNGDRRSFGAAKPHKKYVFSRLWRYLSRYKLLIILSAVLVSSSKLLELWGPRLAGKAIDAIGTKAGGVDFATVGHYVILMLISYGLAALLSYILSVMMVKLSRLVVYRLRKDVFESLSTLPVSFFDRHQTGEIISVITYDIDTVNSSLSTDFLQVCLSIITVVGALYMMLRIAPRLVLIFVFMVPASILITRFITKRSRPLFRERSARLGELNGFVEEMLDGQKTTRAYNREKVFLSRFDKKNEEAVRAYTKAEYIGSMVGPSNTLINNISLALISMFGALLYLGGSIGLGDISSFVLYSRKFAGPINETANIFGELQSALAAAERVFRLIDELPEAPDDERAEVLKDIYGNVELQHVSFGYEKNKPIIKDMNIKADKGKLVAIVGPTGAGKTTIINLLMRYYDYDTGKITIDGKDILHVTRDSLRSAFTMVLQDTWLFNGTIFENIAYGKENATLEEVVQAAKAAHIHSFITKLPQGYNTVLSTEGLNISKGQKQLLTIARAMLQGSKMLILDEATSNVDTQTEIQIQASMRELMRDRTCFVIAHRLSTIQNADVILVMRDGMIVEQGTHDTLMAAGGFYYELYHSQFVAYE